MEYNKSYTRQQGTSKSDRNTKMTAIAWTPATEKTSATENYESKCEEKNRVARRRSNIVNSRVHNTSTAAATAMVSATSS
jgi:hypothetical protein